MLSDKPGRPAARSERRTNRYRAGKAHQSRTPRRNLAQRANDRSVEAPLISRPEFLSPAGGAGAQIVLSGIGRGSSISPKRRGETLTGVSQEHRRTMSERSRTAIPMAPALASREQAALRPNIGPVDSRRGELRVRLRATLIAAGRLRGNDDDDRTRRRLHAALMSAYRGRSKAIGA